mmetsp:Transcript_9734/g.22188  ORF Transcript_9734/g.22188 Transcript_9734/m.22188 type:complete len:143 (+) Transcript_9734:127-555(+)
MRSSCWSLLPGGALRAFRSRSSWRPNSSRAAQWARQALHTSVSARTLRTLISWRPFNALLALISARPAGPGVSLKALGALRALVALNSAGTLAAHWAQEALDALEALISDGALRSVGSWRAGRGNLDDDLGVLGLHLALPLG